MSTRLPARDDLALHLVHAAGLAATIAGLVVLRDTDIGADPLAAVTGAAGQLGTTGPAAVAMALAAALNLGAGTVIARLVAGHPFPGVAMTALAGLCGAVVFDTFLLSVLAGVGLFHWPVLAVANAAVLVAGVRARPFIAARPRLTPAGRLWPLAWLLVLLVWSGPFVVQLASPVVPFLDVLPNHVAPVEHLRAFGGLASIDTTPSPIYGPSRIFLGYQSLLGVVVELVEIPAVTAIGAFALPLTVLVGAAGYGLARAIAGPTAGLWALLLVPLSVTFLRVAEARAGVVAFPLAALAFWLLLDVPTASRGRRDLLLTAALATAILMHPLIGLLTCGSIGVLALIRPLRYAWALPATAAAPAACLGQWAAMIGLDAPPWIALLGVPAAAVVLALGWAVRGQLARRPVDLDVVRRLPLSLVGIALIAAVLVAIVVPGAAGQALAGIGGAVEWYVALLAAGGLSLVLARKLPGWELPWGAVVACALIGALVAFVPTGSTLRDAIRFELPKTLTYFGPTFLALAGAVGLAAAWEARHRPAVVRAVVCGLVLVLAAAPIRSGVVHELSLGEHRLAESLSIWLRNAAIGYWRGFPDQRRLIDAPRAELVAALRREIAGGRLTGRSRVLHVAASFQPWAATPLAVFTGAIETTATLDPEVSIHTEGGRLANVADLSTLLLQGFDYVVLEPDGLADDAVTEITAAGFTPVFVNARGSVYHRPFIQRLVEARARPR